MGPPICRAYRIAQGQEADHPARRRSLRHETAAMQALLLVAEHGGPTMFARIGVMRALNRHVERVFDPSRKDRHGAAGSWRGISDRATFHAARRLN